MKNNINNKKEILRARYKIASIKNGILPAGSHVFPFTLKVPANLQPSFDFKSSSYDKSHFTIEYELNAYVMDDSANSK